jgi:hypothetical protein
MTRWLEIALIVLLIALGAFAYWWFTSGPPVG